MKKLQNIYDDENFFNYYNQMRETKINANELIEIPTIKRMLPDLTGKTVLDLGCGAGGMSQYFIDCGAKEVLAIDLSENMINLAKNLTKTDKITYKVMAMEDISTINQKFDFVFSSLAFHYIEDFDKLIHDISNLLNDNGILLFSQEHPVVLATILCKDQGKYIENEGKRYYYLSDYNNVGERKIHWTIDGVVKYHRNFETILNTLIKHHLCLVRLEESKASEEAIKLVPKYIYQKDRPYFLFVKAQKSNN